VATIIFRGVCAVLAGTSLIVASRYDGTGAGAGRRPPPDCRWHPPTTSRSPERETVRRGAVSSGRRSGAASPTDTPYDTRFKMLHSPTGLYFLMEGTDRTLTATMTKTSWTCGKRTCSRCSSGPTSGFPCYSSTRSRRSIANCRLLIPNFGGRFLGWRPWHYDSGIAKTRKATSIIGGPKQSQAAIQGWRAEFFIPYTLAVAAAERPPEAGQHLARELLSDGSRRGQDDAVGVGAGR
jgi:hypothetical protein